MCIRANIFQTWHSKKLPIEMFLAVSRIKKTNPRFNYYLFDDNDCRNFIKKYFDENVLNAYDTLIPGAYKADLWRYCVLYKMGGIYLDIKYIPVNNFKFKNLLNREYWVTDTDENGIYNALMVCKAGNLILLNAINKIVENVKNKYYGSSFLEPTGPLLLGQYFTEEEKKQSIIKHKVNGNNDYDKLILLNNYPILQCFPNYYSVQNKYNITKHYSVLWNEKNIYL
jgi:mannosyltransferase OCH1-like enzyme